MRAAEEEEEETEISYMQNVIRSKREVGDKERDKRGQMHKATTTTAYPCRTADG